MSGGELYLSDIARHMEKLIFVLQKQNELIEGQNKKLKDIETTFDDLYTQVELVSSLIEDYFDNVPVIHEHQI